jgi:hypothetical protein
VWPLRDFWADQADRSKLMSRVDFKITKAWPDSDDRDRLILRYEVQGPDGQQRNLVTPIGSQLSRLLRPDIAETSSATAPDFSDLE